MIKFKIITLLVFLSAVSLAYAFEYIHHEKDGYTWIKAENGRVTDIKNMLGETIISMENVYWCYYDTCLGGNYRVSLKDWFKKNKTYEGVIDIDGTVIVPTDRKYDECYVWEEGWIQVFKNKRVGACDLAGNEIIPPIYKKKDYLMYDDSLGFYTFKGRKKRFLNVFLDKNLIKTKIKHAKKYQAQMREVANNEPFKETVNNEATGYSWILLEKQGYAAAMNLQGDTIIPMSRKYEALKYVCMDSIKGYFIYEKGKKGICLPNGAEFIPPVFDDIKFKSAPNIYGYFKTSLDMGPWKSRYYTCGVWSLDGKEIISAQRGKYRDIEFKACEGGVGWFDCKCHGKDMKNEALDINGNVIIDATKSSIYYYSDYGFVVDGNAVGIRLDELGIADFSQKEQMDAEKRERRAAMWSAVALGVAQAGMEITGTLMQQESSKKKAAGNQKVSEYDIVTPAGKVIKAPESYVKMKNGEYNTGGMQVTFDQNGNPMISNAGLANFLEDSARETAQMTADYSAKHPNSASARANAQWAQTNLRMQMEEAQYMRTPHYAQDVNLKDVLEESEKQRKERSAEREASRQELLNRARNSAALLTHSNLESSGTSSTQASTMQQNTLSKTSKRTLETAKQDNLDSHQQFKSRPVASDDYLEIKKVNLYIQDGGTFRIMFNNVPLCKKGAHNFIKIGNKYYPRTSSNTSRFPNAILYGSKQLYYSD